MKDRIEIGEYVRTEKGFIDKIQCDFNKESWRSKNTYGELIVRCECHTYLLKNILKHSKSLIDLIEVGDYVNGMEVYKGKVANGKEKLLVGNHIINGMALEVVKIKTILTHEMYERNCYEVEE